MLRFLLLAITDDILVRESIGRKITSFSDPDSSITFPTLSTLPMISTPATFSPTRRRLVSMNPRTIISVVDTGTELRRTAVPKTPSPRWTVLLPNTDVANPLSE